MDTLGAAVHHPLHTVTLRRFQHVSRPGYFDIPVHAVGLQDVSEGRGQVVNEVASRYRAVDRIGVAYRASDQFSAKVPELSIEQARILVERSHTVSV
jgi:hypothetical protein